jgi:hypothetical protein
MISSMKWETTGHLKDQWPSEIPGEHGKFHICLQDGENNREMFVGELKNPILIDVI